MNDKIFCFLDTNAMIHFRTFEEVDWLTILATSEVYLILAPIVLNELDKLKLDSSNEWRQKRARALISKLKNFQPGYPMKIRDNVFIELLLREPQIEWATMGLDGQVNDDRLIASLICF